MMTYAQRASFPPLPGTDGLGYLRAAVERFVTRIAVSALLTLEPPERLRRGLRALVFQIIRVLEWPP